jgi:dihydropteroate synthase
VIISIDTYKPAVARAALAAGAHVLNDIHGLQGAPELAKLAAEYGAAVVAMHHDERFRDFVRRPGDTAHGIAEIDLIGRMKTWLARSVEIAVKAGVRADQVALDPGIGFFKTQEQNLEIMGRLTGLRELGCPLLLGASRKSVIGKVLGGQPVEDRLEGTLATTTLAVWQGVEIVRVHDVAANIRAARMARAIRAQSLPPFSAA